MGRLLLHVLSLGGCAAAAFAATAALGLHPLFGPPLAAFLYVALRGAGRWLTDGAGRRLLAGRAGLEGVGRGRLAAALDLLDRGHPDVARSTLAALRKPGRGSATVYQV